MMGMKLKLRPMMFMTMQCTGCGRFISKPEEAATDDEIDENFAAVADAETVYRMEEGNRTMVCKKCGRPFKKRKGR